jgi:hypothetical protein
MARELVIDLLIGAGVLTLLNLLIVGYLLWRAWARGEDVSVSPAPGAASAATNASNASTCASAASTNATSASAHANWAGFAPSDAHVARTLGHRFFDIDIDIQRAGP